MESCDSLDEIYNIFHNKTQDNKLSFNTISHNQNRYKYEIFWYPALLKQRQEIFELNWQMYNKCHLVNEIIDKFKNYKK